MQREPLERLQQEGVRGLKGVRTQFRFRKKNPPEILEMELLPRGRVHPDCLPTDRPATCPKCERYGVTRPSDSELILDAATLPEELDLFRLEDFDGTLVCTEPFMEAVRRLGYDEDIAFHELPLRTGAES